MKKLFGLKPGLKQNFCSTIVFLALAILLLPFSANALEQTINPTFTGNANDWNPSVTNTGGYDQTSCGYDGAVGGGSVRAMLRAIRGPKVDGSMEAECYQTFSVASAANIEVCVSDYYQVTMADNNRTWTISATGGLYKNSDGTLVDSLFRQANYSGLNAVAFTGPNRPATWTALLSGAETYTIRLNWVMFMTSPDNGGPVRYNYDYHWFDQMHCNISPHGLAIVENAAGNAYLTWNQSSTPAGGVYALDYYKIYSSTTGNDPWTLVDTTTNEYYEHNPADNDLYYCIADVDQRGQESPKSVSCLYRRTRIEITQVTSPKTSVTQGQGGVPVTVTLMNPGPSDISFGGASLTFKIPAVGQYNWTRTNPAIGTTIPKNGGTLNVTFSVDVLASSTPDTDIVDATATGTHTVTGQDLFDTAADITHSWLIRSPAKLKVLSVTTPTTVYLGQTGVPVDVLVENEGDDNAAALWDSTDLKFSWGTYINIVPQTTLPIQVYAGQATSVRYLLEVDPSSATGTAIIDAWVRFRDSNLLIPSINSDGGLFKGEWTIVAGFVNTYKDAAKFIPKDSFNVGTYTVYARAENLMPLKEHRMRWYDPDGIQVDYSNPAITTSDVGEFDDELTQNFTKTGTWRVTCTRVFDSIVLAENYFEIGNPASLTHSITLPDSVSLGQTFIATVTVNNIGSATAVDVELATMTLVLPDSTGNAAWVSGPSPVRQNIAGESSKSYQLYWEATAIGDLYLQCAAFGFDDNLVIDPLIWSATSPSNICVVQTPPNLTITSLSEVYSNVSPGQEDLIVDIRVSNSGQADAIFDAASLTYNPTGGHSESVVSPATGTLIPGGGYLDIRFNVDIDPAAISGARTISATVRGYDANNPTSIVSAPASGTGDWTILSVEGVLSRSSSYSPEQYAFNKGQQIYCRFTVPVANDFYRIAVYDDVGDAETQAAAYIWGAPAEGTGNVVILDFNTTAAGDTKYHTWRVDLRDLKFQGPGNYTDEGLIGRLYFENQQPSSLSGELLLSPEPSVEVGATVTVTLFVQNPAADGSTIATVTPTLPEATDGSAGSLTYLSGPVPTSADIMPGNPATFTWYYRAQTITGLSPASYSMIATFTGTDLNSGVATSGSDISNSIVIAQRKVALASATISFGEIKVGEKKWVGPSSVVNSGNVALSDLTWRASHLIHTNESDYIHRGYMTFSPPNGFGIAVSSSEAASFSLDIPYNQLTGTYTVSMDVFDDYYLDNDARDAEEPYASFTVEVYVSDTEIVDVNETLIDLGNWPQGSTTSSQTVSALNLGNVDLSVLKFEMLNNAGLSANTSMTILPAGPEALATDGILLASVSAQVWDFEPPGVYITSWRLYEDNVALEASDTFQVRVGIGDMDLVVSPAPLDMGNGTPTYTITDVPITIENTGDLDLTKLKLAKADLTDGGSGVIPGENIIPELPAIVASNTTEAATMSLYVAAGVPAGDYSGGQTMYEDLNGNDELDTGEPSFNFIMHVHVNEFRAIQVLAGTIDFGGRTPGEVASISFQIKNIGSVDLIDLQWQKVDLVEDVFANVLAQSWYEFQPIPTPFTLTVGQLYDAVGSITIDTTQPDGSYSGTPGALSDVQGVASDPTDTFTVLCQVGGKSLEILTDPITITAADPGSTSDSAFFEVKNTGKLLLVKATASAASNLVSGGNIITATACNFSPTVFDAMNSGQTKSAYWSVDVPPGTNAGTYTATLLVWNDDNSDGAVGPLEASDTATLEIEVLSKRVLRVESNPTEMGFVPAGQTGSASISIYNDGNIDIADNIRLHAVPLDPVAPGPNPLATITMNPDPIIGGLATGTMITASINVEVPVGQTSYPYSGDQVIYVDDNANGSWDAGEPAATFTLNLTVGQKLLSVEPLVDLGTITSVGPHNKTFWVKNDTTITLSYGTWGEISPLTKGADIIPSTCLDFLPVNFTVGAGSTKSDCIASLTLDMASWPQGVYIGTYTAFEDDNGNGIADGFEASDTFQIKVTIGGIGALDILAVSPTLPLDAGTLDQGGSTGVYEVSYQNTGNVDLTNLIWNNMTLYNGGDSIAAAQIVFSSPDISLTIGEIATSTVQIGPCDPAQPLGTYMGTQYLYDTVYTTASDAFLLMCEVVAGTTGPSMASGSAYQEIATLTWTPPGATWIMSAWVSLDPIASASISLLEIDGDGNETWRGILIESDGSITASGTINSGVVMSNRTSNPPMTWHRVYFSFTGPDTTIASNTYMVLQNTTEYPTASQSVYFDGIQLERATSNQNRPSPYTGATILVSPNRAQSLEGKYRYYEW
ncbi:MAG: hypothetical protein GQF41_2468 [Candidatus Rifleibacterium amylolyticum]|nr:MAG: hypothetical protein GQF41_2468 [Candidatus Rifleibacterium amylolyticum]